MGPATPRNNYGIATDIVTDRHRSTTDHPGSAMYLPGRVTDRVCDLWALPDNHGLSRIMPLLLRMMPVSLRCHHGRCQHRPEPTTDRPGSWPRPGSSWTIPDRPGFFKQFKISKTTSQTLPDHPGPSRTTPDLSRTTPDHPEPSRQRYGCMTDQSTDSHGSDPGQSLAVQELDVTVVLAIYWRLDHLEELN